MRIRRFTMDDYEAAAELWRAANDMSVPRRDEMERVLGHAPDLVLVAEDDGRVAGVVVGTDDGRRGWIFRLAVAPDRRCERIGRTLVEEVESRLVARGAVHIRLLVVGTNEAARRFWEATGYEAFEDIVMYSKDVRGGPQAC